MSMLSIIIVNWNIKDILIKNLKSIFKFTQNLDYEVIVVDNNSKDKSVEEINKIFAKEISSGKLKVIDTKKNNGFSKGNNIGFEDSRGEYILFMNKKLKEIIEEQLIGLITVMFVLIFISWIVCIYQYSKLKSEINLNLNTPAIIKIHHHYSTTIEYTTSKEDRMKEYVKREVEKAGLDWNAINCLIEYESRWDEYAIGVNKNGSKDIGLYQINEYWHKDISREDKFNYKKATDWAINKILRDGNMNAWNGYTNFCK